MEAKVWQKYYDEDFELIKRRKCRGHWRWIEVFQGEGSDSAFHDWDYHIFLGISPDGRWAGLKNFRGIKPEIIALTESLANEPIAAVARRLFSILNHVDIFGYLNDEFWLVLEPS